MRVVGFYLSVFFSSFFCVALNIRLSWSYALFISIYFFGLAVSLVELFHAVIILHKSNVSKIIFFNEFESVFHSN